VRFGLLFGRAHYQVGFHQTATAGAFGATLAAARLLGLDAARAALALGLAATRASGLKAQFGTMGKPYNAGVAAANGVEAALLAAAGFVSRPEALDGPHGFGATHAGAGDTAAALDSLGARFVFETVSHKLHACCHGLHAALETAATLRDSAGLAPAAIETVEVAVSPRWMTVCAIPAPRTGLEAKFSYALTLAMAFCGRDTAALATFSDAACADPALLAIRDRVRVTPDAAVADTAARLTVVTTDGRTLAEAHDIAAPAPLSDRAARVRAKAAALLGPAAAEAAAVEIAALRDAAPSALAALTAAPKT
jgi:2-methylcitrate dehydratase PrpD